MKKFLAGCALAALATSAAYAQETTSTIRGDVTSGGKPVVNATVTVLHIPSGTRATVSTDRSGSYSATGLRPGGPYSVTVTAPGFGSFQATDINTAVGEPLSLPIILTGEGPEIVVTGSSVKGARVISEGPATVLTAAQISNVASVNRDIRDLMRRDPFANIDKSNNDGSAGRVSFAGQNSRFNRFTVDGVPITDSFGLNPDALPSRRGPVPIDAIGQFETKVAPYDIREGFFQGGVINATLKSGTNQFHGTGFYSYLDDGMVGTKTKPYAGGRADGTIYAPGLAPKFKNRDFGATLSGPIIKDKLFFMVSAERVRAATPYPYGTIDNNGGTGVIGVTSAQLAQVQGISNSVYGYNPGGIVANNGDKDDRIVGRIDANISSTQRLSITGLYTKDSQISLTNTGTTTLSLGSNSYIKPNRVIAGIAQLNSEWGGGFATEVRGLYKQYDSGQIPIFPLASAATICTAPTSDRTASGATTTAVSTSCQPGFGQIQLGTGGPSQANILNVKTYAGSFLARLSRGDHNMRALVDVSYTTTFNEFVNGAAGTYYFDSIADFQNRTPESFSYTNSPTLDPANGAAKFAYSTYTFGLQDSWRFSNTLNLTYGARYDMYGGHSAPAASLNFLNRYGFGNYAFVNGRGLFQPRIGFDYTPIRRLTFRGGVGIFGGGTPDVYVGNSFSNTGVLTSSITARLTDGSVAQLNSAANPAAPALLNNVSLTSLPATANSVLIANSGVAPASNTTLNALDPHFKIPSQWRGTLSASYDADLGALGDHWRFGVAGLASKTRYAVAIVDLRSVPIPGSFTPDGRQRYQAIIPAFATDGNADLELTNSKKGRSYIAVATVSKAWKFGLSADASFTYQNVKDNFAFTSSIANSNYIATAVNDPNSRGGGYGHSNDEVPYAFKYTLSYEHAFYRDYKTRFSLFGETRQGYNYSYTFQDISTSRSTTFGTIGAPNSSNGRYLFYVPKVNDPLVVYAASGTQTAAQAQAVVENLINSSGLAKYRGQIAPRNAFHDPWFTRLDLHVEQEIPTFVGRSRITVWADIENFTNLLDHKWGQQLRTNFPSIKTVVKVTCQAVGANACGQYVYSAAYPDSSRAPSLVNSALGASLYAIRVGARFSF
ncbi:hypothetical protein FHS31_000455 [Sphingomonas vulcanisoli]|uniref:TonB-dependent receptor n=1 Tax=Sphingomonas vulcanisoli TaxID=1658060 RepID=A0ABX0TP36_9SPHN|nr:TonB-dependent receptor [Sphingomonas vulcanisoli]NIJ06873.1 hypothetical protein [Sphingomonas vulcanisoli]